MGRELQIERIVLGSIIANFDERWPDVRHSISEEMFADPKHRELFRRAKTLATEGRNVDPVTMYEAGSRTTEDALAIFDLSQYDDFTVRKWQYDVVQMFNRQVPRNVTFADYVKQLRRNHERRKKNNG